MWNPEFQCELGFRLENEAGVRLGFFGKRQITADDIDYLITLLIVQRSAFPVPTKPEQNDSRTA